MAGRKNMATMELAIGATIISGVIILIVMLMAWGNTTSFLGRHYRVVVNMTNVGGLKEGAPVKMGGFQIGRVASIQIRPGGTDMEIVLDIDENRLLPKGSTAKVSTAGLVGDAFMEIIPGKSSEMIRRATNTAEAERLESSPIPDISEIFAKVNAFGDQLTQLTTNLNDIIGDTQFRKNIKSLAVNMDAATYQAQLILQRGQSMVDNLNVASQNIATLSDNLRSSVETVTEDVKKCTASVLEITDKAKATVETVKETATQAQTTVARATSAIENIDGGVTEARKALAGTFGNPKFAENLSQILANANTFTTGLAERRDTIDNLIVEMNGLVGDLHKISGKVREITADIEPSTVSSTLQAMTGAIESLTEIVEKIKQEPVLALSINKAADRIVKMKFDEMSRQPQFRSSDAVLQEINRWVREQMKRGYMTDPSFPREKRPYVMDR